MRVSLRTSGWLLLLVFMAGCSTSTIQVGTARTPVNPADVKVYLHAPANYEEIGLVRADNIGGSPFGRQAKVDTVMSRLKVAAGKLGANGLLLNNYGQEFTSLPNGSYAGSGVAIYVPPGESRSPVMTPPSQRIMIQ
jgi:hypothetical protein